MKLCSRNLSLSLQSPASECSSLYNNISSERSKTSEFRHRNSLRSSFVCRAAVLPRAVARCLPSIAQAIAEHREERRTEQSCVCCCHRRFFSFEGVAGRRVSREDISGSSAGHLRFGCSQQQQQQHQKLEQRRSFVFIATPPPSPVLLLL